VPTSKTPETLTAFHKHLLKKLFGIARIISRVARFAQFTRLRQLQARSKRKQRFILPLVQVALALQPASLHHNLFLVVDLRALQEGEDYRQFAVEHLDFLNGCD